MSRLKETSRQPTISTPTNPEAHQISLALREAKQAAGLIGSDVRRIKATSGKEDYVMALAPGDRVRLFKSTGGTYFDTGKATGGSVGRNGTVLTVVEVNTGGMLLETAKGRRAAVDWKALADERTGRTLLAYGDASTMHRSQGSTTPEHIWVLPSGSAAIAGDAGY